jgi:pyruvate dehydrogenase E2 component (dihydrolipoamide acetyltransferase)
VVTLEVLADEALAGPATRRLARELGVDLREVKGSGPRGRITAEDVKLFARQRVIPAIPPSAERAAPETVVEGELPDFSRWGPVEVQPFRSVRRKTAAHVSLAWSVVPHVTHHDEADVTELDSLRNTFRAQAEAAGGKLTLMAFIIKASVLALQKLPQFNSSLDLAKEELVLRRYYNIGVAVDTERGLLVPVLRAVEQKGVIEIAVELTELAERTRQNRVKLEELQGGTFTITNLGGIGGTGFTPIVNYPEVAILGVSRMRPTPLLREGEGGAHEWETRLIVPLSLSYDHRVIDGAAAARFTRHIAELLENPAGLLELR